ncbi:hypothetical protein DVDV_1355 [Desulfovibrio sp. DV]|nr:hypothetical protein DVDV_1355 [Desulfovibrio sp. DV]
MPLSLWLGRPAGSRPTLRLRQVSLDPFPPCGGPGASGPRRRGPGEAAPLLAAGGIIPLGYPSQRLRRR